MRRAVAMKRAFFAVPLLAAAGFCFPVAAQTCLEYGPTVSLTGRLRTQIFPGPPNYQSIRRGDRKETALLLTLEEKICTTGNDPQGFDVPEAGVHVVQLVITDNARWKTVRHLVGKRATVTGTLFHANTGHDRTKVLVIVASIRGAR